MMQTLPPSGDAHGDGLHPNCSMNFKKPEIIIIAALAKSNRLIGKNGKVPWSIPEDSQRFQAVTHGYPVIMGRKTWEHDLEKCPLANRLNIVITSTPQNAEVSEAGLRLALGVSFVTSLDEALKKADDAEKIYIVGGASIYTEALAIADTLDLTLVEGNYEGDTFFPPYEHLIGTQLTLATQLDRPGFSFVTYHRVPAAGQP
jgi:dihydrofolate reductase